MRRRGENSCAYPRSYQDCRWQAEGFRQPAATGQELHMGNPRAMPPIANSRLSRSIFLIAATALFGVSAVPSLAQQGSIVFSDGRFYTYSNESERKLIEGLISQRQDIERLRQDAINKSYDYRDPTPEEIAEKVKAWNKANPFTSVRLMPNFATQKIPVEKNDALKQKLADVEMRLKQLEAKAPSGSQSPVSHKAPSAIVNPKPANTETPLTPNPASVTLRKLPSGQVVAIIGSKLMKFNSEAEAQAYIAGQTR